MTVITRCTMWSQWTVAVWLAMTVGLSVFTLVGGESCPQKEIRSDTINIAIAVYGPPPGQCAKGVPRVCVDGDPYRLPSNPLLIPFSHHTYATQFYQSFQLFEEQIHLQWDGAIPLRDGGKMKVNVTYFSVGPPNDPLMLTRAATLANRLAQPAGNSPYLDETRHFSFIVPPVVGPEAVYLPFMTACETTKSCIIVATAAVSPDLWICTPPLPEDCIVRNRLAMTRRFDYSLSSLWDSTNVVGAHLDLFRSQKMKSIVIMHEYSRAETAIHIQEMAFIRGMEVIWTIGLDADNLLNSSNLTANEVAMKIVDMNPDTIIIVAGSFRYPIVPFIQILNIWRNEAHYAPSSLVFTGGFEYTAQATNDANIDYSLGSIPSIPDNRGLNYRAHNIPGENFELFSSNATHDSPQVWKDAFLARFGSPPFGIAGFVWPMIGTHTMLIMQKLVEAALSADATELRTAASSISVPSVYTRILFDVYGRTAATDQIIIQHLPATSTEGESYRDPTRNATTLSSQSFFNDIRLLSPAWMAGEFIYPQPTYEERVFNPTYADSTEEKIVLAINSLCIIYIAGWMIFLLKHWHEPVIRASIPSFLILMLIACVIVLITSFFCRMNPTQLDCVLTVWFWTIGLSLMFASLFVKTILILRIWKSQLLTDSGSGYLKKLHLSIVGLLSFVIGVNLAWMFLAPLEVELIVPDPVRISNNYYQCVKGRGYNIFQNIHFGILAVIVLAGMVVTWMIRNVNQMYNDSLSLFACIYNIAVCFVLIAPILSFLDDKSRKSADRDGDIDMDSLHANRLAYVQLNAYMLMFIAVVTSTIMLVPKWRALNDGVRGMSVDPTIDPSKPFSHIPGLHGSGEGIPIRDVIEKAALQIQLAAAGFAHQTGGNRSLLPQVTPVSPTVLQVGVGASCISPSSLLNTTNKYVAGIALQSSPVSINPLASVRIFTDATRGGGSGDSFTDKAIVPGSVNRQHIHERTASSSSHRSNDSSFSQHASDVSPYATRTTNTLPEISVRSTNSHTNDAVRSPRLYVSTESELSPSSAHAAIPASVVAATVMAALSPTVPTRAKHAQLGSSNSPTSASRRLSMSKKQQQLLLLTPETPNVSIEDQPASSLAAVHLHVRPLNKPRSSKRSSNRYQTHMAPQETQMVALGTLECGASSSDSPTSMGSISISPAHSPSSCSFTDAVGCDSDDATTPPLISRHLSVPTSANVGGNLRRRSSGAPISNHAITMTVIPELPTIDAAAHASTIQSSSGATFRSVPTRTDVERALEVLATAGWRIAK